MASATLAHAARAVKRFYKAAEVRQADGGYEILLDGRPVRTPSRTPLAVPTERLARAIAAEWEAQAETIDPRSMPLTGLANAAIDRVVPDRQAFARGLAAYGESDLLCYRAEGPQALIDRQVEAWDPLLAWARRRYDVDFVTTSGLLHFPQPPATIEQLAHAVAALDPYRLAALSPLVRIGGSLIAALAVLEKAITPEQAWDSVSIDERWQLEQWGSDPEAQLALDNRQRDFMTAARFLELLDG
jgi:chaperone required for assembly of F1-ATPase